MDTAADCLKRNCHAIRPVVGRNVRGTTLVELLVVVGLIGTLAGILLPAIQQVRESTRRTQCLNNLKQIGLGIQNFHTSRGFFPTTVSGNGAIHYWAAQILPYMEENPLAAIYDYTVAWNNVKNRTAVQTTLGFMCCPSAPFGPLQNSKFKTGNPAWAAAAADYAGSTGPSSTLWTTAPATIASPQPKVIDGFFKGSISPSGKGRQMRDIGDGASKTVAVFEAAGRPQVWAFGAMIPDSGLVTSVSTKYVTLCGWADPNQFDVKGFQPDATNRYKSPGPTLINGCNNAGIFAFHPNGANLLFVDGSTTFVGTAATADVVASMLTAQGEETSSVP